MKTFTIVFFLCWSLANFALAFSTTKESGRIFKAISDEKHSKFYLVMTNPIFQESRRREISDLTKAYLLSIFLCADFFVTGTFALYFSWTAFVGVWG